MTLKYLAGNIISGLSSDTKPTLVQTNALFVETNTQSEFLFNGSSWLDL